MLQKLIGSRSLITINNTKLQDRELRPRVEMLEDDTLSFVARIIEADELGIWIENSTYPFYDPFTKKRSVQNAYVLVRYEFITSIAFFPELPVENEETKQPIGFIE